MEHHAQEPAGSRQDAEGSVPAEPTSVGPPPAEIGGPPQSGPPPAATVSDGEARTFAMLAHLSALSGFIIPFGHLIGPLLVWLIKREQHEFVDDQGKEALNFQLSISLYLVVSVVLLLLLIGLLLLPAVAIFSIVMTIVAGVKANAGERYRYPLCIRFIK